MEKKEIIGIVSAILGTALLFTSWQFCIPFFAVATFLAPRYEE